MFFSSSVTINSLKLTIRIWKSVCESWDVDGGVTLRTPFFWDMMSHTRYSVANVFKGHNVFNFKSPEVCEEIMFLLCTKRLLLRFNCTCSFIINRWYLFTHKHGYPYINVVFIQPIHNEEYSSLVVISNWGYQIYISPIQYVDIAFCYVVCLSLL